MYIFIINPAAGNGRAIEHFEKLINKDEFQHINYKTYHTKYVGHAEEIAKEITASNDKKGIKAIIIFGGDGTMSEVLNGLQHFDIPISLVPRGSGNDFSRGVSLEKNSRKVLRQVTKNNHDKLYYLGNYRLSNEKENRCFVNCIGFGFDAVVAKSANESSIKKLFNRLKLGKLTYVIALFKQLFFYKPINLTVEVDGISKQFHQCFLATVNNQPYFGGGMEINPKAKNNDKTLSVLVVDSISKLKVLFLFATVFTGKHIHFKEIYMFTGNEMKIIANKDVPCQIDGETRLASGCQVSKIKKPVHILGTKIN